MIESVLQRARCSFFEKVTIKSLIAVGIVALSVLLPQLVHVLAGPSGGMTWMPMYLPVLLGGCLLGWAWGLGVGIASPVCSFLITSSFGEGMPAASLLPFMIAELAVFAAVSGLFSKKIAQNSWTAFPAVLLAQVAGRSFFFLLVVLFQSVAPFTPAVAWSQIQSGFLGMIVQAVLVPFVVMGIAKLLTRGDNG